MYLLLRTEADRGKLAAGTAVAMWETSFAFFALSKKKEKPFVVTRNWPRFIHTNAYCDFARALNHQG